MALVLVIALGWGGVALLKITFQRPRPEQALDLLTATGYAYPSGHMAGVVALSIAVGATFAVTRQSVRARILWQVGSGLLVLAVAFDRWITGAHYISDIVGGALYGRARSDGRPAWWPGSRCRFRTSSSARSSAAGLSPRRFQPFRHRGPRSSSTRPRSPIGSRSGGTWNMS